MEQIIAVAAIEVLKPVVVGLCQAAAQAGITPEQLDQMFQSERAKMETRPAAKLPDPA